ncbi:MAG: metal-dependent hydrolase [Halobacteriaceae archaeon]
MATTHALAGILLGGAVAVVVPEFAAVAFAAGALGGAAPDLDLPRDHRRTLHFPVYSTLAAALVAPVALFAPGPVTVGVAVFTLAVACHGLMDALGGSLEHRPWEATTEKAVFSHYHGRWLRARRWVRYDGAPEDAALAVGLAVPAAFVFPDRVPILAALVALSVGYALVRRRLVAVGEWLVARLPARLLGVVPDDLLGDYV